MNTSKQYTLQSSELIVLQKVDFNCSHRKDVIREPAYFTTHKINLLVQSFSFRAPNTYSQSDCLSQTKTQQGKRYPYIRIQRPRDRWNKASMVMIIIQIQRSIIAASISDKGATKHSTR